MSNQRQSENGTRFRLCAEVLSYALETPEYEWFMQRLETAIPEYGTGEVMIHGFRLDRWVTWSEFPKLSRELDAYRKQLQRLKKHGVKITLVSEQEGVKVEVHCPWMRRKGK